MFIFVLPLDFRSRLGVIRSMYIPCALHGKEASFSGYESFLFKGCLFPSSAFGKCWCGASLAEWYRPSDLGRVYRLLDIVREGCPGDGPVHLPVASATEIGFQWDPHMLGWVRFGLLVLSNLAGPMQHFLSAILDARRDTVAADICSRERCRGGPLLDVAGTLQLFYSAHVRERCRRCSGVCWVEFGMVSYWRECEDSLFHAGSVVMS